MGETEPNDSQPVRKSCRPTQTPDHYYGFLADGRVEDSIMVDDDPTSYLDAIKSYDSDKWQDAMKSDIDSMHINKAWSLEDVHKGSVPIGCK